MNAHKITEEEAYALLRRTSNRLNRNLHDIANDVTVTGALP
jgi:AmiR/NasT family two-component response regulator